MVEYGVADLVDGLEKLYSVLDDEAASLEQIEWARCSVDALLRGDRIELPGQ